MARSLGNFSPTTVQLILGRDQGRCVFCGSPVIGERGYDYSIHHRKPKGMGGAKRAPWLGTTANGVLVHGHGTSGCHSYIESDRTTAQLNGFLINRNSIIMPTETPINHALYGWVLLDEEGGYANAPHEPA